MNPWLERRVLCYAHRGGAAEGPSSTIWAMERAVAAGADALELDVHASADGRLVVCHDPTVDATTDGTGPIASFTLHQLRRLDHAYSWRPDDGYPLRGQGIGIATLDEVLDAFPDVLINLDIKQTAPAVEPYEEALARTLREHGRIDDVIVASFHDAATAAFRTFAPEIGTSAGVGAVASFWQAAHDGSPLPDLPHVALQVPHHAGGAVVCDEVLVEAAHRSGMAVHVWTVDDADEMADLVDMGVDGIMSDVPSVLAGVLASLGAAYLPAGRG